MKGFSNLHVYNLNILQESVNSFKNHPQWKTSCCKLYYHLYLPDISRFCEVSILSLSFMKWKKRENLNSYLMCKKFKYEIPYGKFLCTLLYYEHHVGSVAECLGHWACNLVVPGTSPSPFHPTWWICSWCVRVFSSPLSCEEDRA